MISPHFKYYFFPIFAAFLFLSPSHSLAADNKAVGHVIGVTGSIDFIAGKTGLKAKKKLKAKIKAISLVPWRKAKFKQVVNLKDKFRTRKGSHLKIRFQDNSLIALGPNSKLSVESYLFDPKKKLRQGNIKVLQGFSMYVANKSQNNKKSFFKIGTPIADINARGTQGFISTSDSVTAVANQSGAVDLTFSVDKDGRVVDKDSAEKVKVMSYVLEPGQGDLNAKMDMKRMMQVVNTGLSAVDAEEPIHYPKFSDYPIFAETGQAPGGGSQTLPMGAMATAALKVGQLPPQHTSPLHQNDLNAISTMILGSVLQNPVAGGGNESSTSTPGESDSEESEEESDSEESEEESDSEEGEGGDSEGGFSDTFSEGGSAGGGSDAFSSTNNPFNVGAGGCQ